MIYLTNDDVDIVRKIALLCFGLKSNSFSESIYDGQNPYDLTRTGNVGLQLRIGKSRLVANIPVFNRFTERSPFSIIQLGDKKYEIINSVTNDHFPIEVIDTPKWYYEKLDNGNHVGQYVLREGEHTLISSITKSCGYVYNNKQCRFCAIGANRDRNVEESESTRFNNVLKSLLIAIKDYPDSSLRSINLTGGNNFNSDRGLARYLNIVKSIREVSNIPICIECSPPEDNVFLLKLKEAGANAVMMNVEVWDRKLRELFMPGKATIPISRYIEAWKYSVQLFGRGNVSTVLIIGLENEMVEYEAIDEILKCNVMPSIMPFRPNDGAVLENFRIPEPDVVYRLTHYAAKKAKELNMSIDNVPGCIGCGACAAEKDFILQEESYNE